MKKLLNFFKAPLTKTFILGLLWGVPVAFTFDITAKYLVFIQQYGSLIDLLPPDRQGAFIVQTFGQTISSSQWNTFFLGGILAYLIYKGYITAVTYLTANKNEPFTTFSGVTVSPKIMGIALLKDVLNTVFTTLFIILFLGLIVLIGRSFFADVSNLVTGFIFLALCILSMLCLLLNGVAAILRFNKTLIAHAPFQIRTNFKYLNAHKLRISLSLILLFVWNAIMGWISLTLWALLVKNATDLNASVEAMSVGIVIVSVVGLTYFAILSAIGTGKIIAWIERK